MKKLLGPYLVSFLLISLVGCENINGNFDVINTISLKSDNGNTTIEPATYNATLKFRRKKIGVVIDNKQYDFKIPSGVKIPSTNGDFLLTSNQVKQPYNLFGQVRTNSNYGPTYRQNESCQEQRSYTVCDGKECRVVYHTYYGWRQVTYNIRTDVRDIFVDFRLPRNDESMAHFNSQDTIQTKIYQYQGPCI